MTSTLGKYLYVAELGRGGSAEVHLCIQTGPMGSGFSKLAVLKRLRADVADDPDFAAMLVDEARITARVRHPNVVQTFEVGLDGDTPFLAMEYLDGLPLHLLRRRAQKRRVVTSADVAILVVADALAGLHHAHELTDYDGTPLAVVHRDVSPHNIFVTIDGAVKVVDFGIAKAVGRVVETQTGVVKGKVRYMSPEQAMGHDVDRRADVFAAGVILWEGLTGRRFWADRDELTVVEGLVRRTYVASPRALDPAIPEELDRICQKALAGDVAGRYTTCAEMRSDLESYLGDRVIEARRRLVTLVGELFAEDRKTIRSTVEAAMKTVDLSRTAERSPAMRRDAGADSPSVGPFVVAEPTSTELAPTLVRPGAPDDAIETLVAPSLFERAAPQRRFGARAWCGAILVVGLVCASGGIVLRSTPTEASLGAREPTSATTTHAALLQVQNARAVVAVDPPPAPVVTAPQPKAAAPPRRAAHKGSAPPRTSTARPGAPASLHLDTSDPWGSGK